MIELDKNLEDQLNNADPHIRRSAVGSVLQAALPRGIVGGNVNMHVHSFFSYNSRSWSPSRIAVEAYLQGWEAVGLCDFDVLDGCEEFLSACDVLSVKGCVNLETRTFMAEYSDREIDSPGEPGVSYCMGVGFAFLPASGSSQAQTLAWLRTTARDRNVGLVSRINAHVAPIAVDYERDIVPLSPGKCPTERHIISAYIDRSLRVFENPRRLLEYWSGVLSKNMPEIESLFTNRPQMEELVRSRFAKRGGFGYLQPSITTFPPTESFFSWVRDCGAIPTESWLDGTSAGESDGRALLECSRAKGALALNLIPDRNWNIADPSVKARKVENLEKIVDMATQLGMPLNIGTEMNKAGQPSIDDLDGPVLSRFRQQFLNGAQIFCGHTVLLRFAGFSYSGDAATNEFGADFHRRNGFFSSVGSLPPLPCAAGRRLLEMGQGKALAAIRESAQQRRWTI